MKQRIGLGCPECQIAVYIENTPAMMNYQSLTEITPVMPGEVTAIGEACGNGWRKVFNVYAKLLFTLDTRLFNLVESTSCWQDYRDQLLLQTNSDTALLFSPPALSPQPELPPSSEPFSPEKHAQQSFHIIMGRTYAKRLVSEGKLTVSLTWLDHEFAINEEHRVVVCPYFDYRQLSNLKIEKLANIMASMQSLHSTSISSIARNG
ncbi:hypothetical protein C9J48_09265 [Photobacterium profundum]|uniref:Orphan protein n=1 Tax=Photobacterium profundum 3TCK TaxID=314280 RepID=Q1YXB1_9GAMM|nr:hypothetical protein [Photobacterium profundum]EAS40937.1 hypothetical protein P3TCK_02281 [Photobacterium profundum 3TCK]PSV63625.1 hypothetical protein C9J48_09265 [Photobacterium profundum]